MALTTEQDASLALIHEGWNHLMSQRPLAAWGTWRRALRIDPESAAARQALQTLETAPDLPAAARKVYRFRKPAGEPRRHRWDDVLGKGDLEEIDAAAAAFGRLTELEPEDADAWFNQGLCLAWTGRDQEAIACLGQVVSLEADGEPRKAAEAWALAEILRQGGGAENLADDLRFACDFAWNEADTPRLEAAFREIRRMPTPRDPTQPEAQAPDLIVMEWLDRPFPPDQAVAEERDLPRVLATVYITPGTLRFSSPHVETLEEVEEKLRRFLGAEAQPRTRVAAPLPLPFLDADVWTVRIPEGLDRDLGHRLARETVESYYENKWIHRPRQGLDGLAPLAASHDARRGDAVARAKLEGVVRVREQLGGRSSAVAMYQGYPFDRLRRRLGLDLVHPDLVDPQDLSCAPPPELQALEPDELDEVRLAEAFQSAAGLREDALTARFAAELVHRRPREFARLDPAAVFAPLVRVATQRGDTGEALAWLDQARTLATEPARRTFETWRAEILSRTGRPDEAVRVYQALLKSSPLAPQVALDAAETLLDNGHHQHARGFLDSARELAREARMPWVENLADRHLTTHYRKRR